MRCHDGVRRVNRWRGPTLRFGVSGDSPATVADEAGCRTDARVRPVVNGPASTRIRPASAVTAALHDRPTGHGGREPVPVECAASARAAEARRAAAEVVEHSADGVLPRRLNLHVERRPTVHRHPWRSARWPTPELRQPRRTASWPPPGWNNRPGATPREGCAAGTPIAPQNRRFCWGRSRHHSRRNTGSGCSGRRARAVPQQAGALRGSGAAATGLIPGVIPVGIRVLGSSHGPARRNGACSARAAWTEVVFVAGTMAPV